MLQQTSTISCRCFRAKRLIDDFLEFRRRRVTLGQGESVGVPGFAKSVVVAASTRNGLFEWRNVCSTTNSLFVSVFLSRYLLCLAEYAT